MTNAPVVLEVNRTQDASICRMHGPQVVFAIQKERFTRQKHQVLGNGDDRVDTITRNIIGRLLG